MQLHADCIVDQWSRILLDHIVCSPLADNPSDPPLPSDSTNVALVCGTTGPEYCAGLSWRGGVWGEKHLLSEHGRGLRMLPASKREFLNAQTMWLEKEERSLINGGGDLSLKVASLTHFYRPIVVLTTCIAATKEQCAIWPAPNVWIKQFLSPGWDDSLPDRCSLLLRYTLTFSPCSLSSSPSVDLCIRANGALFIVYCYLLQRAEEALLLNCA